MPVAPAAYELRSLCHLTVLSAFITLVVIVWGLDVAALDRGTGSLPWLVYEQGLYLSGLLAIGLMSLAVRLRVLHRH